MSKKIEQLITELFGNYGTGKGDFYYDAWLNHHAVVKVMNEHGGTTDILVAPSRAKLLSMLEACYNYKCFINK